METKMTIPGKIVTVQLAIELHHRKNNNSTVIMSVLRKPMMKHINDNSFMLCDPTGNRRYDSGNVRVKWRQATTEWTNRLSVEHIRLGIIIIESSYLIYSR